MKALILVGGYGTRMRPLTINFPKSALPFANLPMVEHQIAALAKIGVVEVVIAINYQADFIKNTLAPLEVKYKIKITYSQETEALGTAGPLKLAEQVLRSDNQEGLFFVFNSDIICDFPLQKLLEFHRSHKQEGTIVLAEVEDPSRFGVVVSQPGGRVDSFVEKPAHFISNQINAGVYLLHVSILDRIPQRFCMIEKEIFPAVAKQGKLYSLPLNNKFWYDIGKPGDYLIGQGAYLNYYQVNSQHHKGGVLIDPSAIVGEGCKIGPNVVIGPNCKIGSGCRLRNCAILQGTSIGPGCLVEESIVSWRCKLGSWVRIEGLSCIAEQVELKDESRLSQCMVLSHKSLGGIFNGQVLL